MTPEQAAAKEFVSAKELGEIMGVNSLTIRRWSANSNFPDPYRISRRRHRWRWSEVETYLKDNCDRRITSPSYKA